MLRVPDSAAGKQARCPQCKTQMPVPALGAAPAPSNPAPAIPPAPTIEPLPAAPGPPAISSDLEKQLDFLRQGMTPRPTSASASPAPIATNPFGDVSSAAPRKEPIASSAMPELNPYASPTPTGQLYAQPFGATGTTNGLPWESRGQNVGTWIETTKHIITEPVAAFHDMWPEGGLLPAVTFWLVGILILAVVEIAWQIIGELVLAANNGALDIAAIAIGTAFMLAMVMLLCLAMLMVQSVMLHLLLLMLGGANRGFATTFRVVAYVTGATGWVQVVPCLGGCVQLILVLVTASNGLASAHETTSGKAAAAVIIHVVILFGIGVAIAAGLVALGIHLGIR